MTGRELRAVYRNAGFSRRAFARHLGVSDASLRRFEDGEGMSPANAKKLADYLGVTVVDLIGMPDDDSPVGRAA
jgi:transcriptional regulator with XRE-family HTH domain